MKNLIAVFVIGSFTWSVQAQVLWCSTVVENLETGTRLVGLTTADTPTKEQSLQGLGNTARLGAVLTTTPKREELSTGYLLHARIPNGVSFSLQINQSSVALRNGASREDLVKEEVVNTSGPHSSRAELYFRAERARYKNVPEQYLSPELSYSYNTGKEFIEHQCRLCSPKMGTCPDLNDAAVLMQEAAKVNAQLLEPKLF